MAKHREISFIFTLFIILFVFNLMIVPENVASTDEKTIRTIAPDLEFKAGENFTLTNVDGLETIELDSDRNYYTLKTNNNHNIMYNISIGLINSGNLNASNVTVNIHIFYFDPEGIRLDEWNDNYTIDFIEIGEDGIAYFMWAPQKWDTYYIISFKIDPEDEIFESNEENNQLFLPEDFRTIRNSTRTSSGGFPIEVCFLISEIAGVLLLLVGVVTIFITIGREISYRNKLK